MAKIHKIRRRIRSIGKINQITKAMEKVAASKMKRAQEATLRSRTYAMAAREVLSRLTKLTNPKDHPLFRKSNGNRTMVVLFSSDRGLAGAYNSNLFRAFLQEAEQAPVKVIAIGAKGAALVSKLTTAVEVAGTYSPWPNEPTSKDVRPIVSSVIQAFTAGEVDRVRLIYTDFVSTIKQQVVVRQLLPVEAEELVDLKGGLNQAVSFEPSSEAVLTHLVPRLLEVQLYQASLEALASEHSMRMIAMKNASDNADDLKSDLTLTYNSARQSAITQELAEIAAGAEALN